MYPNFFCTVCNIQLNSENQFTTHVQGQRHLKRVSLLSPQKKLVKEDQAVQSFTEDLDFEYEETFSTFSDQPKLFRCPVCISFVTSDPLQSKQHSESAEHLESLKREVGIFLQNRVPIDSCFETSVNEEDTSADGSLNHERRSLKCSDCHITRRSRASLLTRSNSKMHQRTSSASSGVCDDGTMSPSWIDIEVPPIPPVEERLQIVRDHSSTRGFHYNNSFAKFPLPLKIGLLSSHLAFIGKDEPIPDFRMLLVSSVNAK